MEVFVRNVPPSFSDGGMMAQLQPFMRKLRISDQSYTCEKTQRKPFASITFSRSQDAERFLAAHGQQDAPGGRGKPRSRLNLLGTGVLCKKSNRAADPITLRSIDMARSEAAASQASAQQDAGQREDAARVSFVVNSFMCGHYTYENGLLTFVREFCLLQSGKAAFGKRHLIVRLGAKETRIRIPLSSVHELVWSRSGWLTLTLRDVPEFIEETSGIEALAALFAPVNGRQTIPSFTRLTSLGGEHEEIVGLCRVYRLAVDPAHIDAKMRKLRETDALSISRFETGYANGAYAARGSMADSLSTFVLGAAALERTQSLPFGVIFQLQALVDNNYLHPRVVLELARVLSAKFASEGKAAVSVAALRTLFRNIDWPGPHGAPDYFEVPSLVEFVNKAEAAMRDGSTLDDSPALSTQKLTRIHRAVVTPTTTTLHGPELENENRVLRKFPRHHDHFLRVQFCDENGQDLYFNAKIGLDRVHSRFKQVLKEGIRIANRVYQFLGWSHSSLRSRSVWFVAPFSDGGQRHSHLTIIKALGNFEEIFCPARCAARIGQAFSETPFAVPMTDEYGDEIRKVDLADVKSRDGSRVFSDGVGTISRAALDVVADYLPRRKQPPTCLQIRFAGAKGMLALDSRLGGCTIGIRPSMTKFASGETANLEICDTASKPISLVLNRQMIKLLEDMGVPESWFFGLQERTLADLREITVSAYNTATFLKHQSIGESIRLHGLLKLADRRGLDYRTDSFLRKVVEAVVLRELRLVKHKARIPVPRGITLFGIMDETGFLDEGQVYVTYDPGDSTEGRKRFEPPPPAGPLLVTRSPALHPGDVQRAINTIPPAGHALRELANCIVFSSTGSRDLPSQLSGGDLDGDIYNVLWDPALSSAETFEPADYPRQAPLDIGRRVTGDDMADFFIDFMKTDHLGVIATRHMIIADQQKEGTRDPQCIALAGLHSTAVDFSKTGIAVDLKELPRCKRFRPDFLAPGPLAHVHDRSEIELEEPDGTQWTNQDDDDEDADRPVFRYYYSDKVLGKLFRAVDERKIWHNNIRRGMDAWVGDVPFWDSFLDVMMDRITKLGDDDDDVGWQHRIGEAWRIRSAYEDAMYQAMTDHSEHATQPLTELEVFIGHIINKKGVQTRRQRDRSEKLKDEFARISAQTTERMRGNKKVPASGYVGELDALELCLACVHICSSAAQGGTGDHMSRPERRRRGYARLQSFQVVAASALLREVEHLEAENDGSGPQPGRRSLW